MSLALPAAYTDRELTGTDAGVLRRTKPALYNPILQRMKGDNAKPSSRLQYIDHRINNFINYRQLPVQFDPDCLEGAGALPDARPVFCGKKQKSA